MKSTTIFFPFWVLSIFFVSYLVNVGSASAGQRFLKAVDTWQGNTIWGGQIVARIYSDKFINSKHYSENQILWGCFSKFELKEASYITEIELLIKRDGRSAKMCGALEKIHVPQSAFCNLVRPDSIEIKGKMKSFSLILKSFSEQDSLHAVLTFQYSSFYGGGIHLVSKDIQSPYLGESEHIQYSPYGDIVSDHNLSDKHPNRKGLTYTKGENTYNSVFKANSLNKNMPKTVTIKTFDVNGEEIEWGKKTGGSKPFRAKALSFIELNFRDEAVKGKASEEYSLRVPRPFIAGCAQPYSARIIEERNSNNFIFEFSGGIEVNQYITRIGFIWHTRLDGTTSYHAAWSRTKSCKAPDARWKYCVFDW